MTILISFNTSKFDTSEERPNSINPIAGESVLHWLRDEILLAPFSCTEPDCEGRGWYIDVTSPDGKYLIGSIAHIEAGARPGQAVEWNIQIDKNRSIKEKILGRNKLNSEDPLVQQIVGSLRKEEAISDVMEDGTSS